MNIYILIHEIFHWHMNSNSNKADIRAAQMLLRAVSSTQGLARWIEKKVACCVKCPCFAPEESKRFLDLVLGWMSFAKSHPFPLWKCFPLACPFITVTVISSFYNEIMKSLDTLMRFTACPTETEQWARGTTFISKIVVVNSPWCFSGELDL